MVNNLTVEQIEEIRKVFSLADKDGSGTISSSELESVLSSLSGHAPDQAELARLMQAMDANGDGQISFEEFCQALGNWLKESEEVEEKKETKSRKRKEAPSSFESQDDIRTKIHKKISSFFLQFERASNFNEVRARLQAIAASGGSDAALLKRAGAGLYGKTFSVEEAKQNLIKLNQAKELFSSLPDVWSHIQSDRQNALHAANSLLSVLSICDLFPTADDRLPYESVFYEIFQTLASPANIFLLDVGKWIDEYQHPELQLVCASILVHFIPGPRLSHLPPQDPLHYSHSTCKKMVARFFPRIQNALNHLCDKISAKQQPSMVEVQLLTKLIQVFTLLATNDAQPRQFVSMCPATKNILEILMRIGTPLNLMRQAIHFVSVIAGYTHSKILTPQELPDSLANLMLQKIFMCLSHKDYNQDEQLLIGALFGLAYLLPGRVLYSSSTPAQIVMKCLTHPSLSVRSAALLCLRRIVETDVTTLILFQEQKPSLSVVLREFFRAEKDAEFLSDCLDFFALCLKAQQPSPNQQQHSLLQQIFVLEKFMRKDEDLFSHLLALLSRTDAIRTKVLQIVNSVLAILRSAFHSSASTLPTASASTALITASSSTPSAPPSTFLALSLFSVLIRKYSLASFLFANIHEKLKTYDPLLKEIYGHVGPCFDFELISLLFQLFSMVLSFCCDSASFVMNDKMFSLSFYQQVMTTFYTTTAEQSQPKPIVSFLLQYSSPLSIGDVAELVFSSHLVDSLCELLLKFLDEEVMKEHYKFLHFKTQQFTSDIKIFDLSDQLSQLCRELQDQVFTGAVTFWKQQQKEANASSAERNKMKISDTAKKFQNDLPKAKEALFKKMQSERNNDTSAMMEVVSPTPTSPMVDEPGFPQSVFSAFFSNSASSSFNTLSSTTSPVSLKLVHVRDMSDIRVCDFPRGVTPLSLLTAAKAKFSHLYQQNNKNNKSTMEIVLCYEDAQGEFITIDSDDVLKKALARKEEVERENRSFRIYIRDKSDTTPIRDRLNKNNNNTKINSNWNNKNIQKNKQQYLHELANHLQVDKQKLEQLFNHFNKKAWNGKLTEKQFVEYCKENGKDDQFAKEAFAAFDVDKSGEVDFTEFAQGLVLFQKGSKEDRLRLLFGAYDKDNNGTIDRQEFLSLIRAAVQNSGLNYTEQQILQEAQTSFERADLDGSGTIDFEEFKRAVENNYLMVSSFWVNE